MKKPKIIYTDSFIGISEIKGERAIVVSDENVAGIYADELMNELKKAYKSVSVLVLRPGECFKNEKSVDDIYAKLFESGAGRDDVLFALGGGVVCDLAGYAAATYKRGMRLCMLPTSLLATVDAAIGGKNGYDSRGVKNLIGTFYQPELVYVNSSALKTLPEAEYISALAEVVKYGVVVDWIFYDYLAENAASLKERQPKLLDFVVKQCIKLKNEVIQDDERDHSRRRILNFGHTLGHAIEASTGFGLSHGCCVSLGMVAAASISVSRGWLRPRYAEALYGLLSSLGLPVSISGLDEAQILRLAASDKKACFILLEDIGVPRIVYDVTEAELSAAVKYLGKGGK